MADGAPAVVRVAATPEQAKIFVALLQAEGIPAHVDGDSLVDEFAMSRRLLNMMGTKVLVPASCLDRAVDILGPATIDAAELEAQAVAAVDPQSPIVNAEAPRWRLFRSRQKLLIVTVLIGVFLWLLLLRSRG